MSLPKSPKKKLKEKLKILLHDPVKNAAAIKRVRKALQLIESR